MHWDDPTTDAAPTPDFNSNTSHTATPLVKTTTSILEMSPFLAWPVHDTGRPSGVRHRASPLVPVLAVTGIMHSGRGRVLTTSPHPDRCVDSATCNQYIELACLRGRCRMRDSSFLSFEKESYARKTSQVSSQGSAMRELLFCFFFSFFFHIHSARDIFFFCG